MKLFTLLTALFFSFTMTSQNKITETKKLDTEWKETLTPKQYSILREKGTDPPSNNGYTNHFEEGTYHCAACNLQLFKSSTKFNAHCGWPSFDDAIEGTVKYMPDYSLNMKRIEIICASCDGHLGHVFEDGPKETTGKRYCVNSTSIKFVKSVTNSK